MASNRKIKIILSKNLICFIAFFILVGAESNFIYAQSHQEIFDKWLKYYEEVFNRKINRRILEDGCLIMNKEDSALEKDALKSALGSLIGGLSYVESYCNSQPRDINKIMSDYDSRWSFLNDYIQSFKKTFWQLMDSAGEVFTLFWYESDVNVAVRRYFEKEMNYIYRVARMRTFLDDIKGLRYFIGEHIMGENLPQPEDAVKDFTNAYYNMYQNKIEEIKNKIQDPKLLQCFQGLYRDLKNIGGSIYNTETYIDQIFENIYRPLLEKWSNPPNNGYLWLMDFLNSATQTFISKQINRIVQFESNSKVINTIRSIRNFLSNPSLENCIQTRQNFQDMQQTIAQNLNRINQILEEIKFKPAEIIVTTTEESIAVIPPIIFKNEHRGTSSFAEITPESIFNEIKNWLFKIAPTVFILLVVVGGILYLLAPINLQNIQAGSEYIKWAVIGYFVLLVISGILSALKGLLGAP